MSASGQVRHAIDLGAYVVRQDTGRTCRAATISRSVPFTMALVNWLHGQERGDVEKCAGIERRNTAPGNVP